MATKDPVIWFFQHSSVLIPERNRLLGADRIRCGEIGSPSAVYALTMEQLAWVTWVSCSYGLVFILTLKYEKWEYWGQFNHKTVNFLRLRDTKKRTLQLIREAEIMSAFVNLFSDLYLALIVIKLYARLREIDRVIRDCLIFNGSLTKPPLTSRRGWVIISQQHSGYE